MFRQKVGEYVCWIEQHGWSGATAMVGETRYAFGVFPFVKTLWRGESFGAYRLDVMHPNEALQLIREAVEQYEKYKRQWD